MLWKQHLHLINKFKYLRKSAKSAGNHFIYSYLFLLISQVLFYRYDNKSQVQNAYRT